MGRYSFANDRPKNIKKGYRFLLSLNEEQKKAKGEIYNNSISTIIGKAGSGKTLLACQVALHQLLEKAINKIVITRPTVSKEDIGHLPGNIYSNMYQLLRRERVDKMIQDNQIEIVPISYMRGRTFLNSCVIVDECQNLDNQQTFMLLQRIGRGSRMMFCGDSDQIDLKKRLDSGLAFLSSITDVEGLHTIRLESNHRHPILDDLIPKYQQKGIS